MVSAIPVAIVQGIRDSMGSEILHFSFSRGGCINQGGRFTSAGGEYFLKWNDFKKYPDMFASEAKGLSLLRATDAIDVPQVIHVGRAAGFQYIILEFIEERLPSSGYWRNFGSGLAGLHKNTSPFFGLDHDNYIGSLQQSNHQALSWIDFFVHYRLEVQVKHAFDGKRIDAAFLKKLNALWSRLSSLLLTEQPALLHGDLWSGNVVVNASGLPCLIDPAVYFGHREMDLAMTQLFGGFDNVFLDSYHNAYPLSPGYSERFDLYNLYPLLVHLNLFGAAYGPQVVSIVNRYL